MGKRVYIRRLLAHVSDDFFLMKQRAIMSCGHEQGPLHIFWSVGDPIWCEECEGTCLACGDRVTDVHSPSFEWGECCERCKALEEHEWVRCVRLRRRGVPVRPFCAIADCARCGAAALPLTGFCSRFCAEAHQEDEGTGAAMRRAVRTPASGDR